MMLKIAEVYFRQLLNDTPPLEAIGALSRFWGTRLLAAKPQFGLSLPEYRVELCLIYTGEVGNGRHMQYFFNRGTTYLNDTILALEAGGSPELARILAEAGKFAPPMVDRVLPQEMDQRILNLWSELDSAVWEADSYVYERLMNYLRANSEQILVPERSR